MDPADDRRRHGFWAAAARMPTGAKLFLILSAALLPLAIIALVATLQTNRNVDEQSRARLGVAVRESARALSMSSGVSGREAGAGAARGVRAAVGAGRPVTRSRAAAKAGISRGVMRMEGCAGRARFERRVFRRSRGCGRDGRPASAL